MKKFSKFCFVLACLAMICTPATANVTDDARRASCKENIPRIAALEMESEALLANLYPHGDWQEGEDKLAKREQTVKDQLARVEKALTGQEAMFTYFWNLAQEDTDLKLQFLVYGLPWKNEYYLTELFDQVNQKKITEEEFLQKAGQVMSSCLTELRRGLTKELKRLGEIRENRHQWEERLNEINAQMKQFMNETDNAICKEGHGIRRDRGGRPPARLGIGGGHCGSRQDHGECQI